MTQKTNATPAPKLPAIETVAIEKLKPWGKNPRKEHAVEQIAKSMEAFGVLAPIIVQKGTYRILAGHGRLQAMRKLGVLETPVVVADLTDEQAAAYTVADNKLTELAEWDLPALAEILKDLEAQKFDVKLTGFDDTDLRQLARLSLADEIDETHPVPAPPAIARTERGDVWQLGVHRLICGDSTNAEDVAKLLAGEKPFLMVTDPPYGVEYDPTWRTESGLRKAGGREGKVANDDRVDWTAAWRLFPGDVIYCWHAGRFAGDVAAQLISAGFEIRSQIIWSKPRFAISRGHYHWKHEPCWYAVRGGHQAKWAGDRTQTTVWEIPLKDGSGETEHGTQKPLECMARPMRNHGDTNDSVYEPFSGSGTTLIAAQALGRRCFAVEIEPRYVDVAVKRWQNQTGLKAVNLTRGNVSIE